MHGHCVYSKWCMGVWRICVGVDACVGVCSSVKCRFSKINNYN